MTAASTVARTRKTRNVGELLAVPVTKGLTMSSEAIDNAAIGFVTGLLFAVVGMIWLLIKSWNTVTLGATKTS